MRKHKFKGNQDKRVVGTFVQLPKKILKSHAFYQLPSAARDILLFVHSQYNGNNNGDLTCTFKAATKHWGMKIGKRTFYRHLAKCLKVDLLIKTVQGGRHKASRFAVASYAIDHIDIMELEKPSMYPLRRFERHEIKNTGLVKTPKKANRD